MLSRPLDDQHSLRLFDDSDAPELYALIEANRAHLSQWMPWAPGSTLETTRDFLRQAREQLGRRDGMQLAITDGGGAILGTIGYVSVDWRNGSTEIGYWLAESGQGRGIMTRAVRALVDHAFAVWDLHRVVIRAASGNARSRAIPERLGFTAEGTLRAAGRLGERRVDHVLYAMLAPEWNRSPSAEASHG